MDNLNTSEYVGLCGEVLQALSSLATVVLAVIGILGLQQLNIAKNTLKKQSLRDARKLSADFVYRYLDRILTRGHAISITPSKRKILKDFVYSSSDPDYIDAKRIIQNNPNTKLLTDSDRAEYINSVKAAAEPYSDLLNEMEAFCSVVTSGVLDEETLYRAVGQNFLIKLRSHGLDDFVRHRSDADSVYTNIAEIYELWATRSNLSKLVKLESENKGAADKIESLKKRLSTIKKTTIVPIGAEDNDD